MQFKIRLKIKKLTDTAIIPTYAHPTDSGMDLYYDGDDILLMPTETEDYVTGELIQTNLESYPEFKTRLVNAKRYLLSTGISIELPPNTEGQVRSRSGLAYKNGIMVLNSPGTIDEGYTGEIKVILINLGSDPKLICRGDRIAQMIICPVIRCEIMQVSEHQESDRGLNGFGSTGY